MCKNTNFEGDVNIFSFTNIDELSYKLNVNKLITSKTDINNIIIKKNNKVSARELAEEVGISSRAIEKSIARLKKEKKIKKPKNYILKNCFVFYFKRSS